ncbi:amidase signature domain-containing protein [Nemania abortiva]|nr:amidase signature domain-containing protein [Nemania abortiva]
MPALCPLIPTTISMTLKVNLLTLTAVRLQELFSKRLLTSRRAVELYLAQIDKHNHNGLQLNAIISVADRADILQRAELLDRERAQGKIRGPLHGVPVIIKDICVTQNMPSTCGSYAFKCGEAKVDAHIIGTLNDAGLIIIAKANLSELGNAKGDHLMAGWSPVGGQTKNPHVEGDIPLGAPYLTSWGPAGSSSGSATAVAAGFSPISLGTELEGSITWPAARAGLYAIKLTPDSVDQHGFLPCAKGFDCTGPYGKTTADVAILSAIIQLLRPDHYLPLATSWHGLKLGFVEPTLWRSAADVVEEVDGFLQQTDSAMFAASEAIAEQGARVVKSIPLPTWGEITSSMPDLDDMGDLFAYQMKLSWPGFLALLEGTPQTVEDLIDWNKAHADLEFTPRDNNQRVLEKIRDSTMTQEQYDRNVKALREAARGAIHRVLYDYDVDVILAPCDSRLNSVAAAAGYPLGNLPLGYADFNGRGFSLHVIAPAGEEAKIFQVMSAWEATFPDNVRPPRALVGQ